MRSRARRGEGCGGGRWAGLGSRTWVVSGLARAGSSGKARVGMGRDGLERGGESVRAWAVVGWVDTGSRGRRVLARHGLSERAGRPWDDAGWEVGAGEG